MTSSAQELIQDYSGPKIIKNEFHDLSGPIETPKSTAKYW